VLSMYNSIGMYLYILYIKHIRDFRVRLGSMLVVLWNVLNSNEPDLSAPLGFLFSEVLKFAVLGRYFTTNLQLS
jgi:hypothetical protein